MAIDVSWWFSIATLDNSQFKGLFFTGYAEDDEVSNGFSAQVWSKIFKLGNFGKYDYTAKLDIDVATAEHGGLWTENTTPRLIDFYWNGKICG